MTSQLSSIFKQSLLVTSIGLVLGACAGGNGLSNNGTGGGTGGGGTGGGTGGGGTGGGSSCEELGTCPGTANVRDFGGKNGKIVWDANHDWFVVGTDGTLYAYDITAGWPSEDSDLVPTSRIAKVRGVTVTNDNAIIYDGEAIGAVAPDSETSGEEFFVLAYGTTPDQGYLDIDYNKNYRGIAEDDKTDARILQINSVAVQHSFQGLSGSNLWAAEDGDLVSGLNPAFIAAIDNDLNFEFTPDTTENYHFVAREFGIQDPTTDLDLRLIDAETGRILGSSYTSLKGELVSFPLVAGKTYGVNVSRIAGTADTDFFISIKASPDDGSATIDLPALGSGTTLRGTIQPVTRFEFCSRFPIPGWADASSDSSSDASTDSLFIALSDASGDASSDASGDASSDIPPAETASDIDQFIYAATPNQSIRYKFTIDNEGGETIIEQLTGSITRTIIGESFRAPSLAYRTIVRNRTLSLTVGDNQNDLDTIEYEVLIQREDR